MDKLPAIALLNNVQRQCGDEDISRSLGKRFVGTGGMGQQYGLYGRSGLSKEERIM